MRLRSKSAPRMRTTELCTHLNPGCRQVLNFLRRQVLLRRQKLLVQQVVSANCIEHVMRHCLPTSRLLGQRLRGLRRRRSGHSLPNGRNCCGCHRVFGGDFFVVGVHGLPFGDEPLETAGHLKQRMGVRDSRTHGESYEYSLLVFKREQRARAGQICPPPAHPKRSVARCSQLGRWSQSVTTDLA